MSPTKSIAPSFRVGNTVVLFDRTYHSLCWTIRSAEGFDDATYSLRDAISIACRLEGIGQATSLALRAASDLSRWTR